MFISMPVRPYKPINGFPKPVSYEDVKGKPYQTTEVNIPQNSQIPPTLCQVYFGVSEPDKALGNLKQRIQTLVHTYRTQVEAIPTLMRDNRINHRVHLRIIGTLLGYLPPTASPKESYHQYQLIFNAVQRAVAPGKKDYRMVCYTKSKPVSDDTYWIQQYGYHVLVFAPNGAVESYRRITPPDVEIDGVTPTNFQKRLQLFSKTEEDVKAVLKQLNTENPMPHSPPEPLSDPNHYSRTLFKLSANGLDAWSQPATLTLPSLSLDEPVG